MVGRNGLAKSIPVCRTRSRIWGAVLAIGGLALALRWVYPTLIEFWYDEAYHTRIALFIAHYGYRPVFGVESSVGVRQLPLFLYMNALPLYFWPHPLAVFYFVSGLHALAIPLTYVLCQRYWGTRAGLIAALLFAVSAWAVLYARKIWVLNISCFTVLFAIAFFRAFVEGEGWAWPLAWLAAAVLLALHLAGLAFVAVLLMAMVLRARRLPWLWALKGMATFALVLSPFLVADARQDWANIRRFLAYSGDLGEISVDAWDLAFQLITGTKIAALAGVNAAAFRATLSFWELPGLIFGGIFAIALFHAIAWSILGPSARRWSYLALLLWTLIPLLLQTYHTRPVYPHYFTILYPAPYVLVAALVTDGQAWARKILGRKALFWVQRGIAALLVVWSVSQLVHLFAIWHFVDTQPTLGGFGTPLKYPLTAAEHAKALAGKRQIVVVASEGELEWSPPRQMFDILLFNHDRRFVDGNSTVLVPEEAAVYLVGPYTGKEVGLAATVHFFTELIGARQVEAISGPNGEQYLLIEWDAAARRIPEGFRSWTPPIRLANGTRLLAYRVKHHPHGWEVWLGWTVDATTPQVYRLYVHGLDAQGNTVAIGDASGLLPYFRRQGDWVFSLVVLDPSVRIQTLRVGMYSYPDQKRIPIIEPAPWAGKEGVFIPIEE